MKKTLLLLLLPSISLADLPVPQDVVGVEVNKPVVDLRWPASDDSTDHYNVYRDEALIGTTIELFYIDKDVEYNTKYIYGVSATGKNGATSEKVVTEITTPLSYEDSMPDKTPPQRIEWLKVKFFLFLDWFNNKVHWW